MSTMRIKALEAQRDALHAELEALDNAVIERGADFTDDERAAYEAKDAELKAIPAKLDDLIKREQEVARSRELSATLGAATNRNEGRPATADVTGTEGALDIYRSAEDVTVPNFFVDIHRSKSGDREAADRLAAHRDATADILRASAVSDFGGLVVPRYAVDKYQALAVTRRTFLNTLVGTASYGTLTSASVIIPKETTGPGMGAQSSENTAFSTANWATSGLTINANTVGGYADVSVQAIQLGQVRQERLFMEMMERYYQEQDRQALWGSGSSGECEGVFLADGTQTVNGGYTVNAFGEIYGAVQEAASKIEINDEREALYVLMSPGRWRSLMSATDASGRPIHGEPTSAPQNVGAMIDSTGQKWFGGLRAVVTNKVVKSGEDDTVMAVYHPDFAYFEETSPFALTIDQVAAHTGTVRYVTYGFMLFSPEVRVNSVCLIQNLGTPSFPARTVS
jgi:HK97 family phage major capsid protein